jgi:hypothetical protein
LIEVFIPRALADSAATVRIHNGAKMFIFVMSPSTREMTSCSTLLAVGGELACPANVRLLWNQKFDIKLKILVCVYLFVIICQNLLDLLKLVDTGQFNLCTKLKTFDKSFKPLSFLENFPGQRQRFGFHATQIVKEFVKTLDCHVEVGPVEFVRLAVALVSK